MEASALSAPAGIGRGTPSSRWLRLRSDEQLVGLFRSGSEEAFAVIHDRYRQRLYGYARQMLGGSGSDAEDVMQDVFLRAYRSLRADERPVSLRAWLYRVAHNRCIDHLRRPVPAAAELLELSRSPMHDPFAEAERREDLRRLVADVRRLPDQQRSALLMREMDGMSYAELADALETSVPAVKSLLVRARVGLVEAVEARDADCADIRHDLAASYDRGVRASGRARRHLRDCSGCTRYRAQLREVRQGFAALSPAPAPLTGLAKLLGLGGAGSGAAAGGAAAGGAAVGTSATAVGGGVAAMSVSKVAVVVCCAVAVTGGTVEVRRAAPAHGPAPVAHRAPTAPVASAPAAVARGPRAVVAPERIGAARPLKATARPSRPAAEQHHANTGGALAPAAAGLDRPETAAEDGAVPDPAPATGAAGAAGGDTPADGTDSGTASGSASAGTSSSGTASPSSTGGSTTTTGSSPSGTGSTSGGSAGTGTSPQAGGGTSSSSTGDSPQTAPSPVPLHRL